MVNWGAKNVQGCNDNYERRVSAKLENIPWGVSWEATCAEYIKDDKVGPLANPADIVNRYCEKDALSTGIWGNVILRDPSCAPKWGTWRDDGCQNDQKRVKYSARLWDLKGDPAKWIDKCNEVIQGENPGDPNTPVVERKCVRVGANEIWGEIYKDDMRRCGMYLGPANDDIDKCPDNFVRQRSAQLMNITGSWEDKCKEFIQDKNNLRPIYNDIDKITDVSCINNAGMWVRVRFPDPTCLPPKWGDWKDDGCTVVDKRNGNKFSSRLWDLKGPKEQWIGKCNEAIKNVNPDPKNREVIARRCVTTGADEIWGEVIVKDVCDGDPTVEINSNDPIPSCYEGQTSGEHGEYREEVLKPLVAKKSLFTLEAKNWITGNKGAKSFLKGSGGAIMTDDNVEVAKDKEFANEYIFKFENDVCTINPYVTYGSRVQLYCVGSNKYIQCGGGTCSGVDDSGECKTGSWQTFTIESATGKTGAVCYGDDITLNQTMGDFAAITPAGDRNVWATAKGTNGNAILTIQCVNGSIYVDPSDEMAAYENERINELCKRDPANAKCTAEFFNKNKDIFIFIGIIIAVLLCLGCLIFIKMG